MTSAEIAPAPDARERLLQAAERVFSEKGYAAAAVHDITDAAGVNRALLYYYFEDKHSLYAAVIEEGTLEFARMLQEALEGPGSYSDRLARFVQGHLELIWRRPDMARLVHRCLLDGHQEEVRLSERFAGAVQKLEAFFRAAMADGEFRQADPAIMARSLIGPTFIFSLWRIYEGDRFPRHEIASQIACLLLEGLRPHNSGE